MRFLRGGLATSRRSRRRIALVTLVGFGLAAAASTAFVADPLALPRAAAAFRAKADGARFLPSADVVRQGSFNDCGPAALANLLAALGPGPVPPLDSIALVAGTGPAGTTLGGLARAARAAGVESRTVVLDPRTTGAADLPLIAWLDRSHFVVIESARGAVGPRGDAAREYTIVDPALGRYVLGRDVLIRRWSGEALLAAPGTPTQEDA